VDQAASAYQAISRHQRERCEDANLVRRLSTYVLIAIVKKELQLDASLYTLLQILSVSVFEKTEISSALRLDPARPDQPQHTNQMNLFDI